MTTMSNRALVQDYLKKGGRPQPLEAAREAQYKDKVRELLDREEAVLVAHYYTDPTVQALAEDTCGLVADSLEMARFGSRHPAKTLVVAGVRFMGETSKILSPEKRVLMPTLDAECSLDFGCPVDEFSAFCDQHPDREVVVYANTSAAVKARADWVVTSSCALEIVEHLVEQDKKIIWAPDRYLGSYIQKNTGADILLWNSSCIVHEEFKADGIRALKQVHPDAAILAHPESPDSVVEIADVTGSTSQLLKASRELPNKTFIVATEEGIFYKMQQASPDKSFLLAPTRGKSPTCQSCGRCPWMAMNSLEAVARCLEQPTENNIIEVDEHLIEKSLLSLQRMLDFTASLQR